MSDLFRKQAVEQQTQRLHGDVLLLPRVSHTVVVLSLVAWLMAVVVWLANSSFARKETVTGWLEPADGVARVYAHSTGIVKKILVSEGDWVDIDQPLAIINGDRVLTSGFSLESVLLQEYESQKSLLKEQLNRAKSMGERRLSDVQSQLLAAKKEITLLELQKKTLNQRYQLTQEKVNKYRLLHKKGHISKEALDAMVNNELELRSERQNITRMLVVQSTKINELKTQIEVMPEESANQQAQLHQRLSDLAQQIAQLHGKRAYVLKSPHAGYVNNLQVRAGHQANIQQPLLTVVPKHASLQAHLLVPVTAAGFVQKGQSVRLRYDAFPYQKFGLYSGKVSDVSTSVSLPNELQNVPVSAQAPTYRLTVVLDQHSVSAYGNEFVLKPGMTFSADIRLAERSLLEWLLEPILSLKGRFA